MKRPLPNHKTLYFDTASTIPMKPEVIESIYTEMKTIWGNPSSLHITGKTAEASLEQSRATIAAYVGCDPDEIIFTGSASAANNLALKGFIDSYGGYIISSRTEHKSITKTCDFLRSKRKVPCFFVDVDSTGLIKMDDLRLYLSYAEALGPVLVAISYANSEIGTIQDINRIADLVHSHGCFLHVDATQCFTKFPIDITNIDLMTVGGSKIGAGKGIGFLYKKKGNTLTPLIHGGEQEQGLIAGTEDVPKIRGLATAVRESKYLSVEPCRQYFLRKLDALTTDHIINGHPEQHLDNLVSISFKGKNAEEVVAACAVCGLEISAGSACSSGTPEPSEVLQTVGVPSEYINGTIRISFPQDATFDDIDQAVEILKIVLGE